MDKKKIYIGAGILGFLILLYLLLKKKQPSKVDYTLPANFPLTDIEKGPIDIVANDFLRYFDVSTFEYWTTPGIEEDRIRIVRILNQYRENQLVYFVYKVNKAKSGSDARALLRDAAWTATGGTFETRPDEVQTLLSKLDNLTQ